MHDPHIRETKERDLLPRFRVQGSNRSEATLRNESCPPSVSSQTTIYVVKQSGKNSATIAQAATPSDSGGSAATQPTTAIAIAAGVHSHRAVRRSAGLTGAQR